MSEQSLKSIGPSCGEKVRNGFLGGVCVGLAAGAVFGGVNAIRLGLRGHRTRKELLSSMAKMMFKAGGVFGILGAIQGAIKC